MLVTLLYRIFVFVAAIQVILTSAALGAYASDTQSPFEGSSTLEGPSALEGRTIDSVIIDNRNIFDTSLDEFDNFFFRIANKLHIKTTSKTIRREVLLKAGQPYRQELADETARNLRTRMRMFDVWVEADTLDTGELLVRVITIDQWSLSGGLSIKHDGDETSYAIGAIDRNLLGRNQFLGVNYVVPGDDDAYLACAFADGRFFGKPMKVGMEFRNDSRDELKGGSIGRPYYNLDQSLAYGLSVSRVGGRVDTYRDDRQVAEHRFRGDKLKGEVAMRFGSRQRKARLRAVYSYRFQDSFGKIYLSDDPGDRELAEAAFPEDSIVHEVGGGTRLYNLDFVTLTRIDGFKYTEDFSLGQVIGLSAFRAFDEGRSMIYDHVEVLTGTGHYYRSNLFYLTYVGAFWFDGFKTIRRTTDITMNIYNNKYRSVTFVGRVKVSSDLRDSGAEALELNHEEGLRGMARHFLSGDRMALMNFESRFFPGLELLSVVFGVAAFADVGRTYRTDEPLTLEGFYASAGVGLRISMERSQRNQMLRLDLNYSEKRGWRISMGTNQYFLAVLAAFS